MVSGGVAGVASIPSWWHVSSGRRPVWWSVREVPVQIAAVAVCGITAIVGFSTIAHESAIACDRSLRRRAQTLLLATGITTATTTATLSKRICIGSLTSVCVCIGSLRLVHHRSISERGGTGCVVRRRVRRIRIR